MHEKLSQSVAPTVARPSPSDILPGADTVEPSTMEDSELTIAGAVPGGWLPAPAAVRVDIHSLRAADASAGAAALRGRLAIADLQQLPADAMLP